MALDTDCHNSEEHESKSILRLEENFSKLLCKFQYQYHIEREVSYWATIWSQSWPVLNADYDRDLSRALHKYRHVCH